jgi:hypothetical protein
LSHDARELCSFRGEQNCLIPFKQRQANPPTPSPTDQPGANAAPKPNPSIPSLSYGPNDSSNLNELNEKDAMNVLDMVCKEFIVDERRICLMSHFVGGAGTLYLGIKYPSIWAALAPIAAAAFSLNPDSLKAIPNIRLFTSGAMPMKRFLLTSLDVGSKR